jgi:hypothetical protein
MTRARDTSNFVGTSTAGGKNLIPNGSFSIWQRGTGGTTSSYAYTCADKWITLTDSGTITTSQVAVNGSTDGTPPGVKYALRINRTAGATADRSIAILIIENAMAYVGQTLTLSFYLRVGSGVTTSIFGNVSTRTAKFGTSSNSGGSTWSASTFNSTTFTRVSTTLTIDASTAAANADLFEVEIGMTAQPPGTNTYFDVTGVQLELGTTATDFSLHGGNVAGELIACQKYYYQTTLNKHLCFVRDSGLIFFSKDFPVTMRTAPVFIHNLTTKVGNGVFPGTAGQIGFYGNGWISSSATTLLCSSDGATTDTGAVYVAGFNVTVGQVCSLQNNDLSYFAWSCDY